MKTVEIWTWRLRSQTTGKLHRSRWKMTEAEALARDPLAVREGPVALKTVYEDGDVIPAHSTGKHMAAGKV